MFVVSDNEIRLRDLKEKIGLCSIEMFQMYKLFYLEDMCFEDEYLEYKVNAMMCILDEYGIWDNPFKFKTKFEYHKIIKWVSDRMISLRFFVFVEGLEIFDRMHGLNKDDFKSISSMESNFDKELVATIGFLIDRYCKDNNYDKYDFIRVISCILCFRSKNTMELFNKLKTDQVVCCDYRKFVEIIKFVELMLGLDVGFYNVNYFEFGDSNGFSIKNFDWEERQFINEQLKQLVLDNGRIVKRRVLEKDAS